MAEAHVSLFISQQGLDRAIQAFSRVYNGDKIESEDYATVGRLLTALYNLKFDPGLQFDLDTGVVLR